MLNEPTVVGQSFDQVMVLQSLYGCGPILGILSTGDEWRISWLPEDDDAIRSMKLSASIAHTHMHSAAPQSASAPTTPSAEQASSMSAASTTATTAATTTPALHVKMPSPSEVMGMEYRGEVEVEDTNCAPTAPTTRLIHTTEVLSMREKPEVVLQHIVSALLVMCQVQPNYSSRRSSSRMYFLKNRKEIAFYDDTKIDITSIMWGKIFHLYN